jgi:D-lactate dehydrogenase
MSSHPETKLQVSVFDTKVYDREYLSGNPDSREIDWKFHDFRLSAETAPTVAGSTAVCLFVNDKGDRECLEILKECGVRMVALRCAGFNNVDLDAAAELGLSVVRVPAYSPHAVAEHAVALLLTLNRKIHRSFNRVRELNFSLNGLVGFDVVSRTIGVIGTGKIGRIAAQIFRGFGSRVLAYDVHPDHEWANSAGIEYVDFDSILSQSDILSLHIPLMNETFHLINKTTIKKLKKGAYIINTSRGRLIDTTALITELKSGHIGGVALDVYEEEEGVFFEDLSGKVLMDDELSLLLNFPNVLITSHQAFLTHEALQEIARVTVTNLIRGDRGETFLDGTVLTDCTRPSPGNNSRPS